MVLTSVTSGNGVYGVCLLLRSSHVFGVKEFFLRVDGCNLFPKVDLASRIASRVVQQGLPVATVNVCWSHGFIESVLRVSCLNYFELYRTRSFGGIQLDVAKAVQDAAKVQTGKASHHCIAIPEYFGTKPICI